LRRKPFICFVSVVLFIITLCISGESDARSVQKDENGMYDLDNSEYRYSLRIQSGFMTGTANEIVYAGSGSGDILSRLTWEIDDLFMVGIGGSMQQEWVAVHADAWFKVVDGNGIMDDYDWLMNRPEWSHWSHHDNTIISEAYAFDVNSDLIIPGFSSGKFLFSAIVGYKSEHYEWESRGGYYTYSVSSWRDLQGSIPPDQIAITYSQNYDTPYIGLGLRGSIGKFEFSGRIIGSVYTKVEAKDTHHMRSLKTESEMDDGEMYSFDVTGSYSFTKHLALEAAYTYTKYETNRWNSTYQFANGVTTTFEDLEGADFETDMISIVLSYSY
jgi:outer membrane protease